MFTTQLVVNGLIAGSVYALVALGFALIYGTTRFFHFAHGAVYTAGAYLTYALAALYHLPLGVAISAAVLLSCLLGLLTEVVVYRPLRRKYAATLVLLIASLGLYVVIQNVISVIFGDDIRSIRSGIVQEGFNVLGARITPVQAVTLGVAVVLFVAVGLVMSRTRVGKALRAVANDPELALISGVNSERVILSAFAIGSGLAAVAAILVSFDVDMVPTMGMNALLMGVVATIIGGIGSIPGAAVGGLLLGLAQHLGVWKIGSQWQDSIAFAILLVFLLVRPYGVFGRKLRKAEI